MSHTQAIFLSPEATVANRNVAPWLRFRKFLKDAFHYITILPKVPSVEKNSVETIPSPFWANPVPPAQDLAPTNTR